MRADTADPDSLWNTQVVIWFGVMIAVGVVCEVTEVVVQVYPCGFACPSAALTPAQDKNPQINKTGSHLRYFFIEPVRPPATYVLPLYLVTLAVLWHVRHVVRR